jgi:transglutaminase-like putative cysteine protease
LRSPFALAPFRTDDALSTALAADRVELDSFGAAKKSDRVVLRMNARPERLLGRVLRLREAVFTDYRAGVWTRNPYARPGARARGDSLPALRPGGELDGKLSIELNLAINGFLFLPYGAAGIELDRGFPASLPDGVVQVASRRRAVQYTVGVRGERQPRGMGASAIDPAIVPTEVRDYAAKLTGDLADPRAIYARIQDHLAANFVYTLDPPPAVGDPIVHFLTRSRAGHCEFFASAAAMMLASRGIPARLVTGSYGGELGLLSRSIVVRARNLHAWVEADLDGTGFVVLDPTPPAGIPEAESRVSLWSRVGALAREVEFFYDRRILGFDSLDQAQVFDAARQSVSRAAEEVASWRDRLRGRSAARTAFLATLAMASLAGLLLFARRRSRRKTLSPAKRAYLTLRRLLARRAGSLSPALPPAEVARRYAGAVPAAAEDARAVVEAYCRSEFGGERLSGNEVREVTDRIRRLRKLA